MIKNLTQNSAKGGKKMDAKTIIAAVLIGFIVGGIVYLQVKRKKK